ncbi:ribosomal protein S18-alanine N-acetyltransferase [Pelotomaculum propionicicum]|uniref:ribosomal protein S18-alanine N-acetyltransferase n=1 Tax=Pelotomaculum propionicicum TaxID=258475 RepID=UPI003B80A43F
MSVTFEEMRLEHLDQVLEIEKASFPTPWSRDAFKGEILQNDFARYIVAIYDSAVIGYGGMWIILDEAHITNVAVRPDLRGKSIGKVLMLEIIRQAVMMGANSMTLEVRPSNNAARKLYQGLGFIERGLRKRYYSDTNEDAIIMWKENLPARGFKVYPGGRYML